MGETSESGRYVANRPFVLPTRLTVTKTAAELLKLAAENKVSKLVEICRELSSVADERPAATYGGSFRYFKRSLILGVNIAGEKHNSRSGELDVWIPASKLPEIVSVSEEEIRKALKAGFAAIDIGATECLVRLKAPEQAQALVSLVRGWLQTPVPDGAIETDFSKS